MKKVLENIKILKKEIKKFNPDIVIGVGGYVTAPVIYAAKKLGYKTFIHEQNSIPGLSNKFLTRYVDKIGVSLPDSIKYFKEDKTIFTGNPRSEEVYYTKEVSKKELGLGLENNKKLEGKVLPVLLEGTSEKKDMYFGYSDTNKLINFTSNKDITIGDIVDVKIVSAKTWSLDGELVE